MARSKYTKLDGLWQQAVRKGKKKCEVCGNTKGLNGHHIFSRTRMSTRWDIYNGILLCVGCHTFSSKLSAHKAPRAFFRWLEKDRGKAWLDALERKSNQVAKGLDKKQIEQDLKDYINPPEEI